MHNFVEFLEVKLCFYLEFPGVKKKPQDRISKLLPNSEESGTVP